MAFFLLFVLVAVVLGIIGIVVLVADVSVGAVRLSLRVRRRPLR